MAPESINLLNRAIRPFGFNRPPLAFAKHYAEYRLERDHTHFRYLSGPSAALQEEYIALVKIRPNILYAGSQEVANRSGLNRSPSPDVKWQSSRINEGRETKMCEKLLDDPTLNAYVRKMKKLAEKAARIAAWILALAIVILSIVPAEFRPQTSMPHQFEHFAIFFATGVAYMCGYSQRALKVAIALGLPGMIEIAQIYVPGRHARFSDFIVDAAALCAGLALASVGGARRLHQSV